MEDLVFGLTCAAAAPMHCSTLAALNTSPGLSFEEQPRLAQRADTFSSMFGLAGTPLYQKHNTVLVTVAEHWRTVTEPDRGPGARLQLTATSGQFHHGPRVQS